MYTINISISIPEKLTQLNEEDTLRGTVTIYKGMEIQKLEEFSGKPKGVYNNMVDLIDKMLDQVAETENQEEDPETKNQDPDKTLEDLPF